MERSPLYLASASPRRRQLLADAGIAFEPFVVPVAEEELAKTYRGALESLGEFLARAKARAAVAALAQSGAVGRVIASDTTVLLDGHSLAKPGDALEATAMLRALRGREHLVATGVALAEISGSDVLAASSITAVEMRPLGDDEIARYVATGDPLDKAGAYSIQHPQFQPVARLRGCHLGVIGLPLCLVGAMLGYWSRESHSGAPCPWSSQCTAPLPAACAPRIGSLDPPKEDQDQDS